MPLENRVTPFGAIVAEPWRGLFMGNRGQLHDEKGHLGTRRWTHQRWICCLTRFRGRKRDPMPKRGYTALFFWDEASALAAGHRPCAQCRHADYQRFVQAWAKAGLEGRDATSIDRHLHRARVGSDRIQIRHRAHVSDLPDGVFVVFPAMRHLPMLTRKGRLWHLCPEDGGYLPVEAKPAGKVTVLTPAPIVAVLGAGYSPLTQIAD